MTLKIAIGGDHAGFAYKQELLKKIKALGHHVEDFGAHSESSADYPDFAHPLAKAVAKGDFDLGILVCGSGNGVCITANKHAHIRAALCWNAELVQLARQHNNANVLCLPARFISLDDAQQFVELFLNTQFEGGRHENRINKINC